MRHYNTIFYQILRSLNKKEFQEIVDKSGKDKYVKKFKFWDLFKVLLFAQISGNNSLRSIVTAIKVNIYNFFQLSKPRCLVPIFPMPAKTEAVRC